MAINLGTATPSIHSLSEFIKGFQGGTRPNRFKITFVRFPAIPDINTTLGSPGTGTNGILAISSTLPESMVGTIPIPFRGRVYKFPGDRDYLPWNITIMDDTGTHAPYAFWHGWSNLFNDHSTNLVTDKTHLGSYSDIQIEHLDHNSTNTLKTFTLMNAWPMQVGPLELNSANTNQLSTFTCQLAYTHYMTKI